jgi:outer membrane protein OmpA-like peptidoglycan-associated protein
MTLRNLSRIAVAAAAFASVTPFAGAQESPTVGIRVGFGPSGAAGPDDAAGEPTLLFGTAFTGSSLHGAGVFRYPFNPYLAFRGEVAFARTRTTGFAEGDDFKRELEFTMASIGVPLGVDGGYAIGPIDLRALFGFAPRFGASAAAVESRSGNVPNDPAIEIRSGLALDLLVGAELAARIGRVRIPVTLRYARNLLYPNTTVDRYDNYTDGNPGRYLVDIDWSLQFLVGVDFALSASEPSDDDRYDLPTEEPRTERPPRERRNREDDEPELTFVPAYIPPQATQTAPPPPDQDMDGITDALDACPIEPSSAEYPGPVAGCPASGGIVQVSCDRIYFSEPVQFEVGSDVLLPESYPVLTLVADTLNVTPNIRLARIEGHTDDRGSDDANLELSDLRAGAVVQFLIDSGVDPTRLEYVGYGEMYPIESNDTADGRTANRRVEIHIVENDTCR